MDDDFLHGTIERLIVEVHGHAERLARLEGAAVPPTAATAAVAPGAPPAVKDQGAEALRLEERAEAARQRLAETQSQAEAADQRLAELTRRGETERATLDAKAEAVRAELATLAQVRRVQEKIWPRFLLAADGPFVPWKDRLERALLAERTPAAAALLFANLHAYTACLLEADQKYLRDTLRDVSRFLLAWVKEDGADERAAGAVAQQWADAFNVECADRVVLEVPEPGMPINTQWMNFVPRGGASPDVVQVVTWCVRDGQRRVVHRAEVFP